MPEKIINGERVEELRVNGNKAFAEVARRDAAGHIIDKFYLPAARGQEKLVAGKNIASINNVALTSPVNFQIYYKNEVYTKHEVDYLLNSKITLKSVDSLPANIDALANVLYLLTSDQSLHIFNNGSWVKVGISLPSPPAESGHYALQCSVSNGSVVYSWVNIPMPSNNNQ